MKTLQVLLRLLRKSAADFDLAPVEPWLNFLTGGLLWVLFWYPSSYFWRQNYLGFSDIIYQWRHFYSMMKGYRNTDCRNNSNSKQFVISATNWDWNDFSQRFCTLVLIFYFWKINPISKWKIFRRKRRNLLILINLLGFVNGARWTRQGTRILKRVTSEYFIKIPLKILSICFNMLCSSKNAFLSMALYDTVLRYFSKSVLRGSDSRVNKVDNKRTYK